MSVVINSPWGYFSAVARLQGVAFTQRTQRVEFKDFNFIMKLSKLGSKEKFRLRLSKNSFQILF